MRISAIVPTWNRAELVGHAVESVLGQSRPPDEVLVVDDGSTDDTLERLARFGDAIRVLRQANAGAAAARNHGLREAAGDWVAFLDSDDLWERDKLARQLAALEASPGAELVYCDSRAIDASGRPLSGHGRDLVAGEVTAALFAHVMVHTPAVLARTPLLRSLGGFDESLRVCEDYDLWLRASLRTRFALASEPLFVRRVHAQSLAHADDPRHHDQKCLVLERFAQDPEARRRLPPALVRRRLGRVHFTAARAWLRHGDGERARAHLAQAVARQPWNLRARWMAARARVAAPAR